MSDALTQIQESLCALLDLQLPLVASFLCDEGTARAIAGDEVDRGELLLVAESEGDVELGLYVREAALQCLDDPDAPAQRKLRALFLAAEGISHFNYVCFRAMNQERCSQLELELQGEVDKYSCALLSASPRRALRHPLAGMGVALFQESRQIRASLFEDACFIDDPQSELGHRYRDASDAAARFVSHLEKVYVRAGDRVGLVRELRRFYRLGGHEKLRYARSR